jgi:predicted SprT family Zn-dependent metalloprotease
MAHAWQRRREGGVVLSIPERYARRQAARAVALDLMAQHGLHGWTFAFNKRKSTLGMCRFTERRIELSVYLADRNSAGEVRDTVLHEIAHALVGPGHGHDAVWRAKAVELGARPRRCGQADMPEGRWKARCGACSQAFSRHRRPQRLAGWFCRVCGPQAGKPSPSNAQGAWRGWSRRVPAAG